MATRFEIELVDADDPEAMRRAVADMRLDGRVRFLRIGDRVIATLQPGAAALADNPSTIVEAERPMTSDDPLWKAVGIFSGDVTNVSSNKDKYIAEALEEEFE